MERVKYFFPDSQDFIDPDFNFVTELNGEHRIVQRDDLYCHECFSTPPYDGMLVSKGIVDGVIGNGARYTGAMRQRFYRQKVKNFLRLPLGMEVMGDCGAFTYVHEDVPPYSVDEVINYYRRYGFDYGIALDHIIFEFETMSKAAANTDICGDRLKECVRRLELNRRLAKEFLEAARSCSFTPIGVVHGWNPEVYATEAKYMQSLGYQYLALGGMVPLKTTEIFEVLEHVYPVLSGGVSLHLLGIARVNEAEKFANLGVTSVDSTSPLMQAFKDRTRNYYTPDRSDYTAIRIPQTDNNNTMRKKIQMGAIHHDDAKRLEKACLESVRKAALKHGSISTAVQQLMEYHFVIHGKEDARLRESYERALEDKPWNYCPCDLCRDVGVEILIFRGTERNKRRGFHNVFVTHNILMGKYS